MSESDDLFADAYRLSVVEEEHRKAIEICRRALTIDPSNYRIRVYLGMLLSDEGTPEEKEESRKHFIDAIMGVKSDTELCDNWFEESAVHHLAIWEWNRGHHLNACLLFLADGLTCHSKESSEFFVKLLDELTPDVPADMKPLFARIVALAVPRE